jgi:hypothetical protein
MDREEATETQATRSPGLCFCGFLSIHEPAPMGRRPTLQLCAFSVFFVLSVFDLLSVISVPSVNERS